MFALLMDLGLLNRVLVAAAGIVISSATIRPVEHLFALELQLGQDRVLGRGMRRHQHCHPPGR